MKKILMTSLLAGSLLVPVASQAAPVLVAKATAHHKRAHDEDTSSSENVVKRGYHKVKKEVKKAAEEITGTKPTKTEDDNKVLQFPTHKRRQHKAKEETSATTTTQETTKAPHIRKSPRFEAMKAAANIRDDQLNAWNAYQDAYRKMRNATKATDGAKIPLLYGEKYAQNTVARTSAARELISAISNLRSVLSARQISILENFKPLHRRKSH